MPQMWQYIMQVPRSILERKIIQYVSTLSKGGKYKMKVNNEKELGAAVYNKEDTIEIEGNLAKKTFKIKATGKVAWGVCIGAIVIGMTATLMMPIPDPAKPIEGVVVVTSYGIAGVILGSAAITAGTIGIAGAFAAGAKGKSIIPKAKEILQALREYRITEKSDNRLVLKRK